jgi:transcriptional regulator with GAF, ATPase, and Fis domain
MSAALTRAELEARLAELIRDARAAGLERDLRELASRSLGALDHAHATAQGRAATGEPEVPGDDEALTPTDDVPRRFGMVGAAPTLTRLFDLLEKVAPSHVSVLILGETGTGKELVARALHDYSPRAKKPFLAENCAAVPANLLESELFGHVRGSFTGATQDRAGHLVAADGGTVFLDEIGDMPLEMQSKLLRVLQDGEVRPVGSNKSRHVDVRVVAATNKDLVAACKQGTFREDLYFRLAVITLQLPPLRERAGDVRLLARYLLARAATEVGRPVTLREDALAALEAWRWPGNVRELENELRRAAALCDGTIRRTDLSPRILG